MRYGYARVSTRDQNIGAQITALQQAGCTTIIRDDGISGVTIAKRPALVKLRKKLRPGDQLVVCALDRLARSMKDLMTMVQEFKDGEVQFRSLKEDINTGSAGGRLIFHVFAALAEFEHDMIVERTRAGMANARANGRRPGPKVKLDAHDLAIARDLIEAGKHTREQIAHTLKVNRSTLYWALRNSPAMPQRRRGR